MEVAEIELALDVPQQPPRARFPLPASSPAALFATFVRGIRHMYSEDHIFDAYVTVTLDQFDLVFFLRCTMLILSGGRRIKDFHCPIGMTSGTTVPQDVFMSNSPRHVAQALWKICWEERAAESRRGGRQRRSPRRWSASRRS